MPLRIQKHVLAASLLLPLAAFAGTMGQDARTKSWSVPLQGGFFGVSQGKSQQINIDGLVGNRYTVEDNGQMSGLAGVGLYFDAWSRERMHFSYGVNLFYLGETHVRGNIIQEGVFTNLSYRYSIENLPLYAAAKAIIDMDNPRYAVTMDAGVGPNFMRLSDYRETPLIASVTPDNAFGRANTTTFSAMAGVGLRMNNLIGALPVECGYRFFYLGKGNLHRVNEQYLDTLSTGNTYANALVCSVTV
ncbi:hypothetical protein E3226_004925 [Legionella geestiana]|uniref:hypothetical protein n=1 Tax=Legionella geestiana TaxID=45065 RepID=UPI0010919D84|nr:hypothetical protein [Legionella geestiana]QDQ39780.1 hypothetical protein E3226_004925 [Legionella geestiana]